MLATLKLEHSYKALGTPFSISVSPQSASDPQWLAWSETAAKALDLPADQQDWLPVIAGNALPHQAQPIAMRYAGHQFGYFAPQLGDGRALVLGELFDQASQRQTIQLKGSGLTPFSRNGDGRAALGPVLREFLISEAMHHLGVPTTRAIGAALTGDQVWRDQGAEPGAVLLRSCQSFLRCGSFEYFARRGQWDQVKTLADYTIQHFFSELQGADQYFDLLKEVIKRQALLVAKWMGLGFVHGVMNTDNLCITGETLDYGPCAFLDEYQPDKKFSAIDHSGRYAYQNQPHIAHWNLCRFAESILPLIDSDENVAAKRVQDLINTFPEQYQNAWFNVFCAKLGIAIEKNNNGLRVLIEDLLSLLSKQQVDFTQCFTELTQIANGADHDPWLARFGSDRPAAKEWLLNWQNLDPDNNLMKENNPVLIPRNHLIAKAIDEALLGNNNFAKQLHHAWITPYDADLASEYAQAPQPEERVVQTFCGT